MRGFLALNVLYDHPGMLSLAAALVNYGLGLSLDAAMDIRKLFLSPPTSHAAITCMENERCEK